MKRVNHLPSFLIHRTLKIGNSYEGYINFIENLPYTFTNSGKTLYHKRNIIKLISVGDKHFVVKSFKKPNFLNKLIYGCFRGSKASRSYKYSIKLLKLGINVPAPVGYLQYRVCCLFDQSYFVSEFSQCPYTYNSLLDKTIPDRENILIAIGQLVAKMHQNKIFHRDLSGGNILFGMVDNKLKLELLDLNRMSFMKISLSLGCKNFERLDATPQDLVIMGTAYAKARQLNPQKCINKILKYNYKYHRA